MATIDQKGDTRRGFFKWEGVVASVGALADINAAQAVP